MPKGSTSIPKAPKAAKTSKAKEIVPQESIDEIVPLDTLVQEPVPKPTKGGKRAAKFKTVPIVAVISAEGDIKGSFTPEPRGPLIAHFPFRTTEVQFHDGPLVYDPRPPAIPQPYDAFADDMFTSNSEPIIIDEKKGDSNFPVAISESSKIEAKVLDVEENKQPIKAFRTIDVMIEYRAANETNSLPASVSAACFWCAGGFEGRPVVLPTQEEGGVYTVYGNFCTLSCAISYLLNEHVDPQIRWERQALLHRMYSQTAPIHPAPPRESLTFFGGILSHKQYRDIIDKKQLRIDAHLPPVISILSVLDTKPIDFYETSLRNTTATGAGLDIVKPMESGLRLKRTKPLKDKESTLDAVMNLHVKVRS
jgi:hypothetical protein